MRHSAATDPGSRAPFGGEVVVTGVRWARDEGAFAVVDVHHGGRPLVLAGSLAHLHAGDRAHVEGDWVRHARFGWQVDVRSVHLLEPQGTRARTALLRRLPGIGPRRAARLIRRLGEGVFDALDADAARVLVRDGNLSVAQARKAAGAWEELRAVRAAYELLAPHGLVAHVEALVRELGAGVASRLRANPYLLVDRGAAFATVDRMALAWGEDPGSFARQEAALLAALSSGERAGHVCLPMAEMFATATAQVGPMDAARLGGLERRRVVFVEDGHVYRAPAYMAERQLAARLAALLATPRRALRLTEFDLRDLSREQQLALRVVARDGVVVLTGNAGTGKTTVLRALAAAAQRNGHRLVLCAPTGRAARRLEQLSGHPAATIHRHLAAVRKTDGSCLDADLVLVDEASMLDQQLAAELAAAVPNGARLVLSGDGDQLPSVGAGRVLEELIASGVVPVARLKHIFRQGERSRLVLASHDVACGRPPSLEAVAGEGSDFHFAAAPDAEEACALAVDLMAQRLPDAFGFDPLTDVIALAPGKHGPCGVHALNLALAERLNPGGEEVGGGRLRIGDRVLWTENDPELGLMNGSLLRLLGREPGGDGLLVRDEDGRVLVVPPGRLGQMIPAYAATVHRTQGCEMPAVIVVLHRDGTHPGLLSSRTLYTAMTRAQQLCVVVGEPAALAQAVGNRADTQRHSGLAASVARATER